METIARDEAFKLLKKYNKDPFHIQHALTVEAVMKWYANELGYGADAEYWGIVGLLHDIDFELYPEEHCLKAPEMLREAGVGEDVIHAVVSHGYGITVGCGTTLDVEPEHEMEKVLFAADELTGLIWAAALMRPSKSTKDMELKSLKKKYKSKGFAAGCSREVIERGAMDYWEAQPFLEGFTEEEKLFLYGAAGGNPHYMSYLDAELSFKDNLKKLFFEPAAPLYKEPIQLLKLDLREPATYNTILCSVACGAGRLNEIAAASDMECNKVSKYLNVLLTMGILQRVNPAFSSSNKISYYEIANNMFVFWYQFVFPYMSSIAIGRGHQVLRNNIMPRIDLFAAHIFKKICLQYCYKLKKRNDFMCDFEQISPWWQGSGSNKISVDFIADDTDVICLIVGTGNLHG